MTKRGISLLLDTFMLLAFTALMSWRLTGVPIHEWLAVGLLAVIVIHLVIHWSWLQKRVPRLVREGSARTRVNVLLNLALFLAMGTALASGFFMSKVIMPNALGPGEYLKWHSIHDSASNFALFILGLHVALNWDLIASGLRRGFRPRASVAPPVMRAPSPVRASALRRTVAVLAVTGLLVLAVREVGGLVPNTQKVLMGRPGGPFVESAPPADIAQLHPGTDRPDPANGGARFLLRFAVLSVVAVAGRKVLRLRLG